MWFCIAVRVCVYACLLPGCAICLCVCACSIFFSFLTALPCKESLTTFFAANLCISVRVWVFVSMCVCVFAALIAVWQAVTNLWSSVAFRFWMMCYSCDWLFLSAPYPTSPHTHNTPLLIVRSSVGGGVIFLFSISTWIFRDKRKSLWEDVGILDWPLPTSQRWKKKWQQAEANKQQQQHIQNKNMSENNNVFLSFSYCSLGHLSCCCCFNTWRRRQRVELDLIFFLNFFCYVVIFHAAGFALVLRLCVLVRNLFLGSAYNN